MSYAESILTEDYVNKFNECLLPGYSRSSHLALNAKSDVDHDSVFTADDVEMKFGNNGSDLKYIGKALTKSRPKPLKDSTSRPLEFDENDALNVERKYQEILKKRRNKTDTYLSPTYQTNALMYNDHTKHQDDQSTVFDDYSSEIRYKKNEIQKDLELERHQRGRKRSSSPNIFLNNRKLLITNKLDNLSPREYLEKRVVDLDNLSTSVQKATMEHKKLCQELQDMQNQLRKNQAEVRLSERMTQSNREKIEDVNKELKAAEHRRNQTLRHLELVTEELNLKKAKIYTLDNQVSREMAGIRRMENYGIEKEEIETILKERDELYQIVKRQEDIQQEKYQLAKELDIVKGDLHSEQERARNYIENLEDDLEASLRMIKELQFEKKELESHLNHIQQHLDMTQEQATKSAREVSELKDQYHSRIKKKLDEYELDKERVEKELKKLEEEKSLDESNLKTHIEKIRSDLKNTEKERQDFKEMVMELEEKLRQNTKNQNQLLEDHEFKIRRIQSDKEEALERLRRDINNEQALLLEEQEIQFGFIRNKIQKECDNEVERLMQTIQTKDQEVLQLSDQLKQTERELKLQLERAKSEFENQIRREKINLEQIQNKKRNQELHKVIDEYECQIRSLKKDLEEISFSLNKKDNQIVSLKNELVDSKLETKRIFNKNMLQMKSIKEGVIQETTKQLKERYEKKMDNELSKIISELDKKSSAKLSKIANEKCLTEEAENKHKQILIKVVKTVAHEINEECRKIALLLNVYPRRVNHSNISDDFSKSDNVITQALANLEACGSEIRNLVEELENKVSSLTNHISTTEINMEKEIKAIKMDLEEEKSRDISVIRDNLLKEHLQEINKLAKSPDVGLTNLLKEKEKQISKLQANREIWKENAANKLAEKFDKLNQRKITELRNLLLKREKELRQLKAIRGKSSSIPRREMRSSSAHNLEGQKSSIQSSSAKVILSLQDNLAKLRNENNKLRQTINSGDICGRKSRLENYKGSLMNLSRSCSRSRER